MSSPPSSQFWSGGQVRARAAIRFIQGCSRCRYMEVRSAYRAAEPDKETSGPVLTQFGVWRSVGWCGDEPTSHVSEIPLDPDLGREASTRAFFHFKTLSARAAAPDSLSHASYRWLQLQQKRGLRRSSTRRCARGRAKISLPGWVTAGIESGAGVAWGSCDHLHSTYYVQYYTQRALMIRLKF